MRDMEHVDRSNDEWFRGTYRIPSARNPRWDYGSKGAYYVTICTKGRRPSFGTIDETAWNTRPDDPRDATRMHRTPLGEAAHAC